MPKITLRPSGQTFEIPETQNLLEALRAQGVYIKSSCGGHATCSDCVVKVVGGEDALTPPPFEELQLLGNVFHITKERLACQTKLCGDATIDISKHDLGLDQDRLVTKTASNFRPKAKTMVRKKPEVQARQAELAQAQEKAERERRPGKGPAGAPPEGEWFKHWEKGDPNDPTPKDRRNRQLGGNRRPRPFRTDHLKNDPEGQPEANQGTDTAKPDDKKES